MTKPRVDTFLERLQQSGLVEEHQLGNVLADLRLHRPSDDQPLPDDLLAPRLVESGMLTQWQCDRILEGRYRGFFLGKYKLLDYLGGGGMSKVYLAQHVLMQRLVAIKVLPSNLVRLPSYLSRFYYEGRAAARLNHHNIVRAYDLDKESGKQGNDVHYLVMEYVEGRDLQKMVEKDGPLSYALAAEYIRQAAEGLAHAHESELVHRDVKPANLMVDRKNVVKILDLGLALSPEEKDALLAAGGDNNVLGTVDYLAPEQARNSHDVDGRADIYGLGCSLYFLLTGHAPFPTGSVPERLVAAQKQTPPSICKDRPDAPLDLVDICMKMMSKRPEDRYPTAGEVAKVLAGWLKAHGHASQSGSGSHPGSSSDGLVAAAGAQGVALAVGTSRAPSRPLPPVRRRPPPPPRRGDSDFGIGATWKPDESGSGIRQPKRALPIATPLEDAPASEFVWGELFDEPKKSMPVSQAPRPGESHLAHRRSRRRNRDLPVWVWPAIAGGLVLAIVLIGILIYKL